MTLRTAVDDPNSPVEDTNTTSSTSDYQAVDDTPGLRNAPGER